MRLEGSIDAFSLPDIFSLLSMTKKTGGLHLRRDGAHGVVWFTTGALTGGASEVSRQSLARRIVGSGLVQDEALQGAVDRSVAEEIGVARALQQAGAIDEGALHDLTAEHIVDTVFDLLRWADGDFAFVVDESNPDDVGVSRQSDDVVSEARRRLEVWANVAATIPSPQTVLSVAQTPVGDPQLNRDEWALLALVDGRRTVGEIVALCGRGDFAVASGLAELVNRGLLQADATDGVEELLRRQEALRRLEGAPAVAEVPAAVDPVADEAPVVLDPPVIEEPALELPTPESLDEEGESFYDADVSFVSEDAALVEDTIAPVTPMPRSPKSEVTPARSDFLPPRQPDHPEEAALPAAAVAGGGATPAPAAAPLIERDPNVNKSLLLRLIAGVRGL